MERGRSVEEGSLKILRLVLMLVSATTVCFTLAMLLVSQSVVGESITSLQVLKAEAQRCPVQQVWLLTCVLYLPPCITINHD